MAVETLLPEIPVVIKGEILGISLEWSHGQICGGIEEQIHEAISRGVLNNLHLINLWEFLKNSSYNPSRKPCRYASSNFLEKPLQDFLENFDEEYQK